MSDYRKAQRTEAEAREALGRVCKAGEVFMSIPPQQNDADLVLLDVIDEWRALREVARRLRYALDHEGSTYHDIGSWMRLVDELLARVEERARGDSRAVRKSDAMRRRLAEIIAEALRKAAQVDCSKVDYYEGLKEMREELDVHIDAAESDVRRDAEGTQYETSSHTGHAVTAGARGNDAEG